MAPNFGAGLLEIALSVELQYGTQRNVNLRVVQRTDDFVFDHETTGVKSVEDKYAVQMR